MTTRLLSKTQSKNKKNQNHNNTKITQNILSKIKWKSYWALKALVLQKIKIILKHLKKLCLRIVKPEENIGNI